MYLFIIIIKKNTFINFAGAASSSVTILTRMNSHLREHTFLVGERLSMADVAVFAVLLPLYNSPKGKGAVKSLHSLTRWYNTVSHQPTVQQVLTERQLVD